MDGWSLKFWKGYVGKLLGIRRDRVAFFSKKKKNQRIIYQPSVYGTNGKRGKSCGNRRARAVDECSPATCGARNVFQ